MLCRPEAVNQNERHKTRQMIADLMTALLPQSPPMDIITARIEMLDVSYQEEQNLRNPVSKKILDELPYPCMTDRYEEILQAHPKIFDWIFSDVEES